jgi:hypothetical protein
VIDVVDYWWDYVVFFRKWHIAIHGRHEFTGHFTWKWRTIPLRLMINVNPG